VISMATALKMNMRCATRHCAPTHRRPSTGWAARHRPCRGVLVCVVAGRGAVREGGLLSAKACGVAVSRSRAAGRIACRPPTRRLPRSRCARCERRRAYSAASHVALCLAMRSQWAGAIFNNNQGSLTMTSSELSGNSADVRHPPLRTHPSSPEHRVGGAAPTVRWCACVRRGGAGRGAGGRSALSQGVSRGGAVASCRWPHGVPSPDPPAPSLTLRSLRASPCASAAPHVALWVAMRAQRGGAIYNNEGSLTMTSCKLSGNSAEVRHPPLLNHPSSPEHRVGGAAPTVRWCACGRRGGAGRCGRVVCSRPRRVA